MRPRKRPMTNTDGFVCSLIREALDPDPEIEFYRLCDVLARLAKEKYGKRNAPQFRFIQEALALLVRDGEIVERYAPSAYDDERRKLGKTYYRKAAF